MPAEVALLRFGGNFKGKLSRQFLKAGSVNQFPPYLLGLFFAFQQHGHHIHLLGSFRYFLGEVLIAEFFQQNLRFGNPASPAGTRSPA